MKSLIFFLPLFIGHIFSFLPHPHHPPQLFSLQGSAQGTTYSIKYFSTTKIIESEQITQILNQIDSSLSLYKPYSLISQFNKTKDYILLDTHLKNVITHSFEISYASNGTFDPTCKPLSELWGFGLSNHKIIQKPSAQDIRKSLKRVGYNNLYCHNDTLFKKIPSVKIDLDGIAQGYSVDVLSRFLESKGVNDFMVELGGEIYTKGKNIHGSGWTVGLEDPSASFDNNLLIKKKVILHNAAITTSGNYRKFKKLGDEYFSHIIDPIKGIPVTNGIISVSVIANNATVADGWDNAFMVMGVNNALKKADSFSEIGVYILYQDKSGMLKDTCNAYFQKHMEN